MRTDHDTMTQQERLEAVLNHQNPDRLPFYLMGLPNYGDFGVEFRRREGELLDPYTEDGQNVLFTPSGDFTVKVFFGADIVTEGEHVEYPRSHWIDAQGNFAEHGRFDNGREIGRRVTYWGYVEETGLLPNGSVYTWYAEPHVRKETALVAWFDKYGWPHDLPIQETGVKISETNAKYKDILHVIPSYGPSTFTHLMMMLGEDGLAYYSRKNPAFLKKIIDSITDLQVRLIERMAPLHPVAVFSGDDLGQKDRALLSPAMFRKIFFENRQRVNAAIHAIGAKSVLHSCGNVTELLPDLIESGLDGWQSLEPASGIDHAAVKTKYGDHLSFWGAIDNNVLCWGTPADVDTEVGKKVKALGANGGYVIGPAHDYLNTKVDNAIALRDAAVKFGQYHLKV